MGGTGGTNAVDSGSEDDASAPGSGGLESGTDTTPGTASSDQLVKGTCGCKVVGGPFGSTYGGVGLAFAALAIARRRARRSTR
jgi:hypothetical protein